MIEANMKDIHTAYFVGIGGIGMSAIARFLNRRDVKVHGYDLTKTPLTEQLEAEGMTIHYEEDLTKIPDRVDLVVFTPAVPSEHKELQYFRSKGYPVKKRAEVLGMISKEKLTIGVAGTHGKTTTTSVLTHILRTGGVDCSAFLGGIAGNFESNYVHGGGEWVVVEADEFDRSFLHLHPELAILTSMDADHLDIYGDPNSVTAGFNGFASQVKRKIFHKEGLTVKTAAETEDYGIERGSCKAVNVHVANGCMVFDYHSPKGIIKDIEYTHPGLHNVENAVGAISIAKTLGVSNTDIKKALASFKGIKRRFEIIARTEHIVYIDDYAHHPEELKAAIAAARTFYPGQRLTGIFQPHLFSRTRDFADGFAEALDLLDEPVLIPIYPARELPITGVTSKMVFDKMVNPNKRLMSREEATDFYSSEKGLNGVEVLMTLGAGNIDQLVPKIKKAVISV